MVYMDLFKDLDEFFTTLPRLINDAVAYAARGRDFAHAELWVTAVLRHDDKVICKRSGIDPVDAHNRVWGWYMDNCGAYSWHHAEKYEGWSIKVEV